MLRRLQGHLRLGSRKLIGMALIKRLSAVPVRFGGEERTGGLPANAATPAPTPIEEALLELEISEVEGGYILEWHSRNTSHSGDLWYETLEGALEQASIDVGIHPGEWQAVEPDLRSFAGAVAISARLGYSFGVRALRTLRCGAVKARRAVRGTDEERRCRAR